MLDHASFLQFAGIVNIAKFTLTSTLGCLRISNNKDNYENALKTCTQQSATLVNIPENVEFDHLDKFLNDQSK